MTGAQVRVLVVDDEESVRNLLQRILEGAGYQVTTAADGKEALYKVSLGEAEIVLMDIKMPGMSGMEVLSKLSAESPDTCVIMVTSIVDTETAVDAMKLGAYDYIIKPFDRDDVLQKVLGAIERWKRRLQEKHRYLELQKSITEKTQLMQEQFTELVNSLARENQLLHELAGRQAGAARNYFRSSPKNCRNQCPLLKNLRTPCLES